MLLKATMQHRNLASGVCIAAKGPSGASTRVHPGSKKSEGILAVVVNWNTKDLLRQCLGSLNRCRVSLPISVVVVDNDSKDGSTEMITAEYPLTSVIRNSENLGFAKANNQAFQMFPNYSYYLLLNSDATIPQITLATLLSFLEQHPRVAAVGPALKLPAGGYQFGGAGWSPTVIHSLNTFLFLSRISSYFRGVMMIQDHYSNRSGPIWVDWLAGACMLIRSGALQDVGLFDERFFVYGEDAEWCWRARDKGWGIGYLPNVWANHSYGMSAGIGPYESAQWFRNLAEAIHLRSSRLQYRVFLLLALIGYVIRLTLALRYSFFNQTTLSKNGIRWYLSLIRASLQLLFTVR